MSFVLDNSVTMRWFSGDGKPQELRFARGVLDAMKNASALVPVTWGLEVANVIAACLPMISRLCPRIRRIKLRANDLPGSAALHPGYLLATLTTEPS